eukprot:TRINITY_DN70725_c0_g1_i1.p1 TRINITY_DN70725_c0_g1~~TRINITY_DN70725_c0_g1_i1.p1  ORF type:complete len:515 (-),score=91.27 TRINITY_DN70725_c0_g1_i1:89-1633(-)
MATVEELKRQIAEEQAAGEAADRELQQALQEEIGAETRQRLRRVLEARKKANLETKALTALRRWHKDRVDRDVAGPYMEHSNLRKPTPTAGLAAQNVVESTLSFDITVERFSYTWQISGMKWLRGTCQLNLLPCVKSDEFQVGDKTFHLLYSPTKKCSKYSEETGTRCKRKASLAMCLAAPHDDDVSLLYRFYVRDHQGEFQPWGEEASVVLDADEIADNCIFGPDVGIDADTGGVFGLCHDALLASDWVKDDNLVVRVDLEVKADANEYGEPTGRVPMRFPPTLADDFGRLLDDGAGSDMVFIVDGIRIQAHSQVLRVRSAVVSGLLSSGLRESTAREIVIDDCDAASFRAFLKFLYTDDLDRIRLHQEGAASACASSSGEVAAPVEGRQEQPDAAGASPQALLAMSHKYEVPRLQQWCEQQLRSRLTVAGVCSVLRQAHLYEACELEDACLRFIKERFREVMLTEDYGRLTAGWPELLLKINLCIAGGSKEDMKAALEKHRGTWSGKRKRDA